MGEDSAAIQVHEVTLVMNTVCWDVRTEREGAWVHSYLELHVYPGLASSRLLLGTSTLSRVSVVFGCT